MKMRYGVFSGVDGSELTPRRLTTGVTFPLVTSGWTSQTGAAAANGAPGTKADPFDAQIAC